jgi:CRP/FNR family transcriptional regulator
MGVPLPVAPGAAPVRRTQAGAPALFRDGTCSVTPCRACEAAREAALCGTLSAEEFERLTALRCHAELPADFTVFREGDVAEHLYSVSAGTMKLYKLLSDGRRQIIGFLFPGDLFGLPNDGGYAYTAETVTDCQVCRFSARKFSQLADRIPRLEQRMLSKAMRDLVAAQDQMVLLGRKSAREKLATFLLKLSRRRQERGLPAGPVDLPMSRADIADYLGLTIETVSRTFTQFKREGVIALPSHDQAVIADPKALERVADHGPAGR